MGTNASSVKFSGDQACAQPPLAAPSDRAAASPPSAQVRVLRAAGGKASVTMRLLGILLSAMPWLIIVGLLWAGLFIKPQPEGATVEPPVIEGNDAFFGIAAVGAADAKPLWAVGNNGKIIHSSDGGASWTRQPVATLHHFQDVSAWDEKHLVAVGNGGAIFVTDDGGAQWQARRPAFLPSANDKLLRVKTFPGGKAWAVGEMSALLFSDDYGHTWQRRRDAKDTAFNDVTMVNESAGWVVGEAGTMLRTVDGGMHWDSVPSVVNSSLMSVAFRDAANGVAVGLEGVILVTDDAGKTWRRAVAIRGGDRSAEVKLHLYDVIWDAAGGRWLAVGDQGVYVSSDAQAAAWSGGRIDPRESAWHTRVAPGKNGFLLAGASVGEWGGPDGGWRRFAADK